MGNFSYCGLAVYAPLSDPDPPQPMKVNTMKRIRRIVLVFSVAVLAIVSALAIWFYVRLNQDPPALAQTAGELVFMSDRDGDWDIYLLDTISGDVQNLTAESDAHEYFPTFTFDGEQVSLFSTATGPISAARVNVDGTGFETQSLLDAMVTVLAEGQTDWDPAWSPGGDYIAWTKLSPGLPPQVDLFVASVDDPNRMQLTDDDGLDGMHAWSPDGAQLVFASDVGGRANNLYVVTVADGMIDRLTNHDVRDYGPVWSMDGSHMMVVFALPKTLRNGEPALHVMNADGSDMHLLGEDEIFTGDLTYAPDGETVAYVSNESGFWHIYLMNADGTNVRQITNGDSNNLYPAWRPVPAE